MADRTPSTNATNHTPQVPNAAQSAPEAAATSGPPAPPEPHTSATRKDGRLDVPSSSDLGGSGERSEPRASQSVDSAPGLKVTEARDVASSAQVLVHGARNVVADTDRHEMPGTSRPLETLAQSAGATAAVLQPHQYSTAQAQESTRNQVTTPSTEAASAVVALSTTSLHPVRREPDQQHLSGTGAEDRHRLIKTDAPVAAPPHVREERHAGRTEGAQSETPVFQRRRAVPLAPRPSPPLQAIECDLRPGMRQMQPVPPPTTAGRRYASNTPMNAMPAAPLEQQRPGPQIGAGATPSSSTGALIAGQEAQVGHIGAQPARNASAGPHGGPQNVPQNAPQNAPQKPHHVTMPETGSVGHGFAGQQGCDKTAIHSSALGTVTLSRRLIDSNGYPALDPHPPAGVEHQARAKAATQLDQLRRTARRLGEDHYARGPGARKRPRSEAGNSPPKVGGLEDVEQHEQGTFDGTLPQMSKKDKKSQSAYVSRFAAKEYEKLLEDYVRNSDMNAFHQRSEIALLQQGVVAMRAQVAALDQAIAAGIHAIESRQQISDKAAGAEAPTAPRIGKSEDCSSAPTALAAPASTREEPDASMPPAPQSSLPGSDICRDREVTTSASRAVTQSEGTGRPPETPGSTHPLQHPKKALTRDIANMSQSNARLPTESAVTVDLTSLAPVGAGDHRESEGPHTEAARDTSEPETQSMASEQLRERPVTEARMHEQPVQEQRMKEKSLIRQGEAEGIDIVARHEQEHARHQDPGALSREGRSREITRDKDGDVSMAESHQRFRDERERGERGTALDSGGGVEAES